MTAVSEVLSAARARLAAAQRSGRGVEAAARRLEELRAAAEVFDADEFPDGEPLPDGVSLLPPGQRAAVAARRNAPPRSSFEAMQRATAPVEGDPPVPLVENQLPSPTSWRGEEAQPREPLPPELSLLTPEQQAAVRARHGG